MSALTHPCHLQHAAEAFAEERRGHVHPLAGRRGAGSVAYTHGQDARFTARLRTWAATRAVPVIEIGMCERELARLGFTRWTPNDALGILAGRRFERPGELGLVEVNAEIFAGERDGKWLLLSVLFEDTLRTPSEVLIVSAPQPQEFVNKSKVALDLWLARYDLPPAPDDRYLAIADIHAHVGWS